MKKNILLVLAAIALFGFYKVYVGIIEQLGMEETEAQKFILNNFVGDFADGFQEDAGGEGNGTDAQRKQFRVPYAKLLPAIVKGDKVKAAHELCDYVKAYVGSDAFAKAYAEKREKNKPDSEPLRPDNASIKQQEEQLKQTEQALTALNATRQVTAAQLKAMEDAIADQRRNIATWKDPTPNKTKWEKQYPENYKQVIKTRLEEYLAISATVDFNATVTGNAKKKFTNPEYEKKSLKWKAIYRAGKDVNTRVTAFVKGWLQEL